MTGRPYVLWDWNGTLLDDTQAAVDALNDLLSVRGLAPVTRAFYRDTFAFPVRAFYTACGVALEEEDWDALAREYHDAYLRIPKSLNHGALAAIERVKASGAGQSIVSALRQDLLTADVAAHGIGDRMDYVFGTDNLDGASKLSRARELLACLRGRFTFEPDFVLIGDSLHDKEVADALGVRCILCSQGSHAAWRLRCAAPTAGTLVDAVALAFGS